ncbi:MAG TPA: type II toxin-antitoxin system prevent-host-death family antitoxin [bacterium]|nr:type II toxin-antitoxin system prevent-host-death family antitoxin [bacterium]
MSGLPTPRSRPRKIDERRTLLRRVALSQVKDDFSRFLKLAEDEEVVITKHGRPAGVLIGFKSEDDWFDYRLERDPRFLRRIELARQSLKAGRGVRLEDVK